MYKFRCTFIFLFLCFNFVIGQETILKIDSLKRQQLINSFPKTVKDKQDFDKALKIIPLLNVILNDENSGVTKIPELIIPAENLLIWAEKNAIFTDKIKCKLFFLLLHTELQNIKQIIVTGNELFSYKDNLSKKQIEIVLNSLVIGYRKAEAYNEIIKITPLRKKYASQTRENNRSVTNELALAFYNTKNYKKAAVSFLNVKDFYKTDKDYLYVASMSNNVGLCYLKLNDYKKARIYFNLALSELSLTKGIDNKDKPKGYTIFFKSVINSNIAKIDIENRNYQKAINSYIDLKNDANKIGFFEKYNVSESYLNISKIYLILKDSKTAIKYLDSCKMFLNKIVSTDTRIDINNQEGKLALLLGKTQLANDFFTASKKLSDSIDQVQIARENILAEAKYNSEEKDKLLLIAKNKITANQKISSNQKIALLVTLVLLLIIAFLLYKNLQSNKVIKNQNKVLQINLNEKELLLKEVHHRVKNNLQVISGLLQIQANKTNSDEVIEVINNSERQINSIAIVHEMLLQYKDFSFVNIDEYINKLLSALTLSYTIPDIKTNIQVQKIPVSSNIAVPLGLIISELVSNSYKHAFTQNKGSIFISLESVNDNEISFIYKDDGKGFVDNQNEKKTSTLGLQIIKMLAEEINGTIVINGDNNFIANLKFNYNEN